MKRHLKKKKQKKIQVKVECPNCGKIGPHFVPASLGEKGFFMCDEEWEGKEKKK